MRVLASLTLSALIAACAGAPAASPATSTSPQASPPVSPAPSDSLASASPSRSAESAVPSGTAVTPITATVEIIDDKRADREGTYEVTDAGEGLCIVDPFSAEPVVDASVYAGKEVEGEPARVIVDHAPVAQSDGDLNGQGGRVEIPFAPGSTSGEHLYRFDSTPDLIAIGTGMIDTVRTGTSVVITFEGQDDDGSTFRGEVRCPTVTGLP